jgi:OOP family OmpA-OmpF porin
MSVARKIAIGAGATALLAWVVHGPLGGGQAFLDNLKGEADARLAGEGLGNVHIAFPDSPASRVAHLSGDATPVQQSDALKLVRAVGGSAGAVWQAGEAQAAEAEKALAAADQAAPANGAAPNAGLSPAAMPKPTVTPTPKPVVAAKPAPAPAPVAVAQPVAANSCQRLVDAAVGGRVMSFRSGSAWLNPTSQRIIADVAGALRRCKDYALEVSGHTDNAGDESINRVMSQERANRVRDALVASGIAGDALAGRGYGSSRPIRAGNAVDPANRRITFTVTKGGV